MVKYRLKDIFNLFAGGDIDIEHFSQYKTPIHCFPIYSNSLNNKGLYGYTSAPKYKGNAITITGRGSVGHAEYRGQDFDAIIRLLVLIPKKSNIVNSYYLTQFINQYMSFPLESTGVPQLTVPQIENIEIDLPDFTQQVAIAEALSDVDSLISSLQKLIEKKKAIKQGAMQELLTGKKRLPGFCLKWTKRYLKEIIVPRKERINPAEIDNRRCIELEHIEPNSGKILGYCESKEQKSLKTIFYPNDILWGKLRPYLRKYAHPKFSGVCSTEFWVFNAINQYACNDFMYYLLQTEDFVSAANSTTGTKMPRADWNLVQELEVKIPTDKNEQRAIAQVLSDMDSEIEQLEKKLAKYQQIKQGMMQELLTGRIRLV